MSKLADHLRRIRNGVSRVGFTAGPAEPDRVLLLVVSLPRSDAALVDAAAKSGADVIVVPGGGDGDGLADAVAAAGKALAGARFQGAVGKDALDAARRAKCVFVACDMHAEASFIIERDLGVVISAAYSWEDSLLRMVGELGVDALEGEPIVAGSPALRIRDYLRLRRALALTGRPLIVPTERPLVRDELEVLVRGGIEAVEVLPPLLGDTVSSVMAAVTQWRESIDALPTRELRRRRERATATLPLGGFLRPEQHADEDEDEDE